MWSPIMNLFSALLHNAALYRWHGWVHCSSAGYHPVGHNTHTIGLSVVVYVKKTILEIYLKCRYFQNREAEDAGPAAATQHWYELIIKDKHCVFGRKILADFSSYPGDPTYAIHKNAFETTQGMAFFCSDPDRKTKKNLVMEVSDLLNLAATEIKCKNLNVGQ